MHEKIQDNQKAMEFNLQHFQTDFVQKITLEEIKNSHRTAEKYGQIRTCQVGLQKRLLGQEEIAGAWKVNANQGNTEAYQIYNSMQESYIALSGGLREKKSKNLLDCTCKSTSPSPKKSGRGATGTGGGAMFRSGAWYSP